MGDRNKICLPGGDWGSWLKNFRQLNPEKPSIVDGTTVVEPFSKEEGNERLFMKPTRDAYNGTGLDDYLKQQRIERVLVCGLITSVCATHGAWSVCARLRGRVSSRLLRGSLDKTA